MTIIKELLGLLEGDIIDAKKRFGKKDDDKPSSHADPDHIEVTSGRIPASAEHIPLHKVFGSIEYNIVHDAGVRFMEKPDYWEDLDHKSGSYRPIDEVTFQKVKRDLKKAGYDLVEHKSTKMWSSPPRGPTSSPSSMPEEICFIVDVEGRGKYLVDRTGASKYIRMWCKILG